MAVQDAAPFVMFQSLAYWACFLLICAVHELSKRTDKAAKETNVLRRQIEYAQDEIRRLQSDLRDLQGAQRTTPPAVASPVKSVPWVASGATAQTPSSASGPRAAAAEAPASFKISEVVWGPALLALIFLLTKFWPAIGPWIENVLQGRAR
ncbi:hypothetical protein QIH96_39845 [Bradyrhizobium japonicum]|uniref:hypothetical protein n=1 Tax=Bradyrhizobium japonicum TaxID=375 RepID=UPI0027150B29|nr:hypothetical protein [Bradyrhizobium japonicum]WLB62581.1 hypothetical protein QIH96_39845 [Bradyrhizobium japonicum]